MLSTIWAFVNARTKLNNGQGYLHYVYLNPFLPLKKHYVQLIVQFIENNSDAVLPNAERVSPVTQCVATRHCVRVQTHTSLR